MKLNFDLANHFYEVFNIHDIGEISYEDIENAVKQLNEPYLILLKYSINGVEDALKELLESANYQEDWVSVKMINRVLKA
ncbi:hypothetical protein [Bacillus rhizoplanae]|uniref:hypothetical protein n=1 Tax=Bacillus rhizoplanae TaxID=2880966 RepID=UPI003D192CD7